MPLELLWIFERHNSSYITTTPKIWDSKWLTLLDWKKVLVSSPFMLKITLELKKTYVSTIGVA